MPKGAMIGKKKSTMHTGPKGTDGASGGGKGKSNPAKNIPGNDRKVGMETAKKS